MARPTASPILLMHAIVPLLETGGDAALAAEARTTAERILTSLPTPALRETFAAVPGLALLLAQR